MSMTKALRDLSLALGGGGEGTTMEDFVREIVKVKNPLATLTVDTEIAGDTDLLGKVVDDLQEDITISRNKISGIVHYLDDYTGFSGDEKLTKGYYIAIHVSVPDQSGYTIDYETTKSSGTLDADGILILRLSKNTKVTFTAKLDGYPDYSDTYTFEDIIRLKG